jgi:drug/metabolite transporter (DMT)-like permease
LVHGGYLGGVFVAIKGGLPAALAALIVGLQPLLTGILAGPLLGEMLTRKKWMGLLLGFLGVWMVVSEKLPEENSFGMDSIFFASLALVSITLGTLYQKRFATKLDIRTGAVIQFISALTIFGLLSLLLETMVVDWNFESIFALFWLAIVLSIGAILILMRLIQSGAAANVASLFYLVPPATAVEAWWLFDEKLGWLAIVGMLVAVLGVAMVVQRPQSQSKASEG